MINTVQNIDCLIGMQAIPHKSIDMILCDLPYGTTACKWDVIIPFDKLWQQYERVIKDNGAIVLTGSQPFHIDLINSNRKLFKYEWIWEKNRYTNFVNAKKQPMRNHENVLVFYAKQPTYNPQRRPVLKRGRTDNSKTTKIYNVTGKAVETYDNRRADDGLGMPGSIIKINFESEAFNSSNGNQGRHPTQKPVTLMEYLIKTYTNEGETVLDNCMGSGTTAIACINTNRNYIGFEKEENYYNIIQDRIKNHTQQLKLIE